MRSRDYRRKQRAKHIKRKENILRAYRLDNPPHYYEDKEIFPISFEKELVGTFEGYWHPYWIVNCRGKLDKGKIHCGCGMCMSKTRNKGRRHISGNYAPSVNYKHSDFQKIQKMIWDEENWEQEEKDIFYDEAFENDYWFLKNKLSENEWERLKNI